MAGERDGVSVLRHDVAGIDVGSEEHWVCAPTLTRGGRSSAFPPRPRAWNG
jgi:hypothetical protein